MGNDFVIAARLEYYSKTENANGKNDLLFPIIIAGTEGLGKVKVNFICQICSTCTTYSITENTLL